MFVLVDVGHCYPITPLLSLNFCVRSITLYLIHIVMFGKCVCLSTDSRHLFVCSGLHAGVSHDTTQGT